MKMKELETRTGIGRETIRYYIREGLLPEPERPKTNVAIYSDEHVRRLELIKTLQRERFLPLGVIRQLLDQTGGQEIDQAPGLFGMEFMLAARLGAEASRAPVTAGKVASNSNLTLDDLHQLAEMGIIDLREQNGETVLSMQDAAIAHAWGRINGYGFAQHAGYTVEDIEDYRRLANELASIEVGHFYDRLADGLDTARATEMAERAIPVALEMFGHLRIKALLREVAVRNAEALAQQKREKQDTPGEDRDTRKQA